MRENFNLTGTLVYTFIDERGNDSEIREDNITRGDAESIIANESIDGTLVDISFLYDDGSQEIIDNSEYVQD